jgi:DNA-binding NtrC family response regulator
LPLHGPRRRSDGLTLRTDLTLAEVEAEYIQLVLDRHRGHRGKTARVLGIDPKTLYNKIRLLPSSPRRD